jgi:hypothetical protein
VTLSINETQNVECSVLFIVMLNVIMLSSVLLNVVMLNVFMFSVLAPLIIEGTTKKDIEISNAFEVNLH